MPISHVKTLQATNDWSGVITVGNSTGGTTTSQASDLVRPTDWNSNHLVSISASEIQSIFFPGGGLTSSTAVGGITFGMNDASFFEAFPMPNTNSTISTFAIGSWYFDPMNLPNGLDKGRINIFRSKAHSFMLMGTTVSNASASASIIGSFRDCIAVYSRGAGANSTRLVSVWTGENAESATVTMQFSATQAPVTTVHLSAAGTLGFVSNISTDGGTTSGQYTFTGSTTQGASVMSTATMNSAIRSSSASSNYNFFSGNMVIPIPFNTTLPPGQYWMAHMFTTHSSATTAGVNITAGYTFFNGAAAYLCLLENTLSGFKLQGKSTVGNSSSCPIPYHGVLLTTTSNATSDVKTADMIGAVGRMYWNYVQDSI